MPIGVSANSRASFWAEMKDETTKYDDCVLISFFFSVSSQRVFPRVEIFSFECESRKRHRFSLERTRCYVSIARTGALIWLFPSLSPDIEEEEGNRVGYDNKF